jgi:hypothetical protein
MKVLRRCLRVATMLAVYGAATIAVSGFMMSTAVNQAQAQRGRGGGRGAVVRGGGRGAVVRGGGRGVVVRGGRGVVRGRGVRGGRGRGIWRAGVWWPWIAPGFCHYPVTSQRVPCPYY